MLGALPRSRSTQELTDNDMHRTHGAPKSHPLQGRHASQICVRHHTDHCKPTSRGEIAHDTLLRHTANDAQHNTGTYKTQHRWKHTPSNSRTPQARHASQVCVRSNNPPSLAKGGIPDWHKTHANMTKTPNRRAAANHTARPLTYLGFHASHI